MVTSALHFGRPRFDRAEDALLVAAAVAAALFASANALGLPPDKTFFGSETWPASLGLLETLPFGLGLVCSIDVDGGEHIGAKIVAGTAVCNGDDDGVSVNVVGIDFLVPVRTSSVGDCLVPDKW